MERGVTVILTLTPQHLETFQRFGFQGAGEVPLAQELHAWLIQRAGDAQFLERTVDELIQPTALTSDQDEEGALVRDRLLWWAIKSAALELAARSEEEAPNNVSWLCKPTEGQDLAGYTLELCVARPGRSTIRQQLQQAHEQIKRLQSVIARLESQVVGEDETHWRSVFGLDGTFKGKVGDYARRTREDAKRIFAEECASLAETGPQVHP